jgi:metal-responsive CopG/Arc/MetJ family transcriptional regulator
MKTIQMTLDDDLVKEVDQVVKELKTTRSAFTRTALSEAITKVKTMRMEEQQRKGYQYKPVNINEFSVWENEQDWGDE